MKISELIEKLQIVKEREGDLTVYVGKQGTEEFKELQEDEDMYLYGFSFVDEKLGLVIHANSRKGYE